MNIYVFRFFNEYLFIQICISNMYYACFMIIIDISEYSFQNDDGVYCVTGVIGITGPSFITKDRIGDLLYFFGHVVE